MKTIKSYIKSAVMAAAAVTLGLGMTACDDMLDTKPQGSFTSEQIGEDEAVDMMTAAYATLLNHYFGNNESFAGPINNWVIDLRSDDALKGGDGVTMEAYMHQLEIGNVQSDNAIINFKWRNNYFSVSRCNTAIKAIDAATSLDAAQKRSMIAEMKTLRAYYYFDMYRLFQKFPYFDETVANPSECRADQYTREQILGFIEADLRDAYNVLPESQAEVGRFNKYVAAAILAKAALFDSDWATVEQYAGYVISSGKYELYANYLDISKPELNNTAESVMAVQFSSANSPDQYNFNNCINCTYSEGNLYGNGDDFYLASQNLVRLRKQRRPASRLHAWPHRHALARLQLQREVVPQPGALRTVFGQEALSLARQSLCQDRHRALGRLVAQLHHHPLCRRDAHEGRGPHRAEQRP